MVVFKRLLYWLFCIPPLSCIRSKFFHHGSELSFRGYTSPHLRLTGWSVRPSNVHGNTRTELENTSQLIKAGSSQPARQSIYHLLQLVRLALIKPDTLLLHVRIYPLSLPHHIPTTMVTILTCPPSMIYFPCLNILHTSVHLIHKHVPPNFLPNLSLDSEVHTYPPPDRSDSSSHLPGFSSSLAR